MNGIWVGATAAEQLTDRRQWAVHSLFDSSVNLRLEPEPGAAAGLIHVGGPDVGSGAPFGVQVDVAAWTAWRRRIGGMPAPTGRWDPQRGVFDGAIRLVLGPDWNTHVDECTVPVSESAVELGISPLTAAMSSGITSVASAAEALRRTREGLADLRAGRIDGVSWLLGRGPGLTPSGDDIVVGMLGALCRMGLPGRSAVALRALADRLDACDVTTHVSRAYLASACRARFAAPLRAVLLALGGADAQLRAAVSALRTVGHTSGADTLLGIAVAAAELGRATRTRAGSRQSTGCAA